MKAQSHILSGDGGQKIALAALLLGAAAIAFAPIFVRISELGPTATAMYRMVFAVPVLGMMVWMLPGGAQETRPVLSRGEFVRFALAGFFFAGDMALWHFSIHFTTVANATLLANVAPVFVTLFGFVLFKTRVSGRFLVGMALAIAGAATLMGDSLQISRQSFNGDLLGLATAVFYASYILSIGRLRARHATVVIMFWSTLFCAAFLIPLTWLSGEAVVAQTWRGWMTLIGLAVVAQVLGQGLIAYALAHLPAAFSSVSLLFQPVVAALAAWVLFGEALGTLQGAGALVVLVGVLLARQGSRVQMQTKDDKP